MNKLFGIFLTVLFVLAPVIAFAQPVPPPPHHNIVRYCYTVLFPVPHTYCEYRYRYYTPAQLPPPRYTPAPRHYHPAPPPPKGHHPGPNHKGPGPGGHGPRY